MYKKAIAQLFRKSVRVGNLPRKFQTIFTDGNIIFAVPVVRILI